VTVARVACRGQLGLHAPLVQVEVSLASGLPAFCIVGLPATVVKESEERVRAALLNSRFEFPAGRITVSLAPAELPKEGGRFDLPIALGILIASGQIRVPGDAARDAPAHEFYGELGLSGELKPVRGLLLAAAHARQQGHELIVPHANAVEACTVAPVQVRSAGHLLEVCGHLSGAAPLPLYAAPLQRARRADGLPASDLTDVRGQLHAKRALVIAAAGAHSLLILLTIGPSTCNSWRACESMSRRRRPDGKTHAWFSFLGALSWHRLPSGVSNPGQRRNWTRVQRSKA
jgi:magnesium chelatase family protein